MLHEIFNNFNNAIQGKPMTFNDNYKDSNHYENEALMDAQDNLFDELTHDQHDSPPILHAYRKYFDDAIKAARPEAIDDWLEDVDAIELCESVNEWYQQEQLNKGK